MLNDRILCISDMHEPYGHPDNLKFLKALAKKYSFTRVVCLGDEVDKHAMSFHDSDPDLPSAGDELKAALKKLRPLYELFPKVDVIESNHGSMHYRKGLHHGIPRKYLRAYNDILEAPAGWVWTPELLIKLPTGETCFFHHGLSSDALQVAQQRGVCVVQGHYHLKFAIQYASTPLSLLWSLQVGCSIDKNALAFAYDKTNLGRPMIGHGAIINGLPKLLPMVLKANGRWNGHIP